MKTIIITCTFLLCSINLANAAPQVPSAKTESIEVDDHHILIPITHKNHWVRVTEKNDGKTDHIVVQSQEGKNGEIMTKRFSVKKKNSSNDSYKLMEYSSSHTLTKQQIKVLLHRMHQQQKLMNHFFAEQQAEIHTQIAATNLVLARLQHQFSQLQAANLAQQLPPPPKPRTERKVP